MDSSFRLKFSWYGKCPFQEKKKKSLSYKHKFINLLHETINPYKKVRASVSVILLPL